MLGAELEDDIICKSSRCACLKCVQPYKLKSSSRSRWNTVIDADDCSTISPAV
jgi:hypothetical protein